MSRLFEQTTINGLTLKNRFVRSATWDAMVNPDGSCSQRSIDLMVALAKGGVGLIMTGFAAVRQDGQALPFQTNVHSDSHVPGLTRLTEAVHEAGAAIMMQIYHGGVISSRELSGQDALGPSVLDTPQGPLGKPMTSEQIRDAVAAFAQAALRVKRVGFDGVQLDIAHGLLLDQFLSPYFNHRDDEYGGSLENRARITLQVVRGVREAVGKGFPVLAKFTTDDNLPGGFGGEDMVQVAKMLEQSGVDATEVSGGTLLAFVAGNPNGSPVRVERNSIYHEQSARRCKAAVGIPVMMAGGIRSLQEAERVVDQGVTDYVALCRPLIREPGLVARWQAGDKRGSACVSENACLLEGLKGTGIRCVHVQD